MNVGTGTEAALVVSNFRYTLFAVWLSQPHTILKNMPWLSAFLLKGEMITKILVPKLKLFFVFSGNGRVHATLSETSGKIIKFKTWKNFVAQKGDYFVSLDLTISFLRLSYSRNFCKNLNFTIFATFSVAHCCFPVLRKRFSNINY